AGRGEVGQPVARPRVPGRGVPRALRGELPASGATRRLPRPQAACARARPRPRLGRRARAARADRALLRVVHPGDIGARLRAEAAAARQGPRLPGDPSMSSRRGELAIVLHSHVPYLEGFGTWPFGEDWL